MNKTLIIVDAQYDFMEGGKLPVEGATKALDNIVSLIESGEYSTIITTQDWHNGKHCSFKELGGTFPEHCVQGTHGADIYAPIENAIQQGEYFNFNLKKGMSLEEFSAFRDRTSGYPHWKEYKTTDSENPYIQFHEDEVVHVCGLAGDICVMTTAIKLKDLNPSIIENCTASIDNETFRILADKYDINIIKV
jgi:nicotinamidase/pyrazinamidase